ncbi:MAG: phosphatase PAP2 family protein [Myxococcales bacterium]|nr:phosphatase PAP2 family protein [Myxococcales bacterium]
MPETSSPSRLRALLRWLGLHERGTLWALFLLVTPVWLFAAIARYTAAGPSGFDRRILLALREPGDPSDPLGPAWLEQTVRDVTALGGVGVLTLLIIAVTGWLALAGKRAAALYALAAVTTGVVASALLKQLFARPRPDLVSHGVVTFHSSFPSGHAMMSTIVFMTLAALVTRLQTSALARAYALLLGALLSLLVGVSRVYLGVHWPTDVLAGWTAGAGWALLCWLVARRLQRRGQLEAP